MKKLVYICLSMVLVFGCRDTTDDGPIGNPNGAQDPPEGVLLVFPYQDTLCNEGENPTPTQSTVFFEWVPNDNAESYTLTIENLNSGNITEYQTSEFIFPVTIDRAVPFRWFVTYDLQGETKESAVWNFYNAGPGVQTYPPFPAEIISPNMAQNLPNTNAIVLQWEGNDVDNDIVSYDIYFGTDNAPSLNTSDSTAEQLTVSVTPGTIYYWEVVTKDAEGNSSESGVYQFRISE
ncbi:hypothetical protein [Winogradskyella flava]|uniref:Fibronectin type-III domain-containing protein n=1 Tax=Winogradskyella flava TaxID=1884876 RepID=A0A842IT27_9FLAO|nr:hypothetical protein [Winogradskyella flava]MBC2846051.1 hypothetical protein [Winogradskyella flava]